jgi:hypothetical protein
VRTEAGAAPAAAPVHAPGAAPADVPALAAANSPAWLLLAIFAVASVPLFATPVLPFIDFYNHLARYHVLATIGGDPVLAENYAAAWRILPNIGLDIVITAALAVVPQAVLAHFTTLLLFAAQFGGVLLFNRALTGRTHWLTAVLIVPLLYSFILNWGFANFLLGLGLMFGACGWWLLWRHRLAVALPVAMLAACAIFLVHGVAFALYGLTLAALELGLWWQSRPRRPDRLLGAIAALAVQAVVPVLLFLAAATSKNAEGLTNADESLARLARTGALADRLWRLAEYRLQTILRVAEGPALWFDAATLVLTVAGLVLMLRRQALKVPPAAWPALALGALLVVVVPPAMFGVGYIADRMPLYLALLLVGCLGVRGRPAPAIAGALTAVVALRLAAIALDWQGYARDDADFARVAAVLPAGAMVESLFTGTERLDPGRRCQMYGPRLIGEHGAVGRLFANASQQPLQLAGPLATAVAASRRPSFAERRAPGYFDAVVAGAVRAGFPWLLICDGTGVALPAGSRVAAQAGRFTLVRLPERR